MKRNLKHLVVPLFAVVTAVVLLALGWIDPLTASLAGGALLNIKPTAGTYIYISAGTPATFNQAGYEALTWTRISDIVDGGAHGRAYNEIRHSPIDSRGVQKLKGSFDEGNKTLQLGHDSDDAGQILLKTALASDNDYSFKVAYNGGDVDYFQAKTMNFQKATGGADSIVSATVTLSIQTSDTGVGIIEVLAP